ncbi:MAG: hypothetical protein M0R80_08420 [Proteobacteria bacterium]|jgi:hypothetical protein|nr:hypothetical protein [Pseudomonadota bacterium]
MIDLEPQKFMPGDRVMETAWGEQATIIKVYATEHGYHYYAELDCGLACSGPESYFCPMGSDADWFNEAF